MRRASLRFAFLLLLSSANYSFSAELVGRVVAITDGDTIKVLSNENRLYVVRMASIDAPEKRQAYGHQAKQTLSDALFDHTVTVIWSRKDRDERLVGRVFSLNGTDQNLRQVEAGMAWYDRAYQKELPRDIRPIYADTENQARTSGIGLWTNPSPMPPWEFRRLKRPRAAARPTPN